MCSSDLGNRDGKIDVKGAFGPLRLIQISDDFIGTNLLIFWRKGFVKKFTAIGSSAAGVISIPTFPHVKRVIPGGTQHLEVDLNRRFVTLTTDIQRDVKQITTSHEHGPARGADRSLVAAHYKTVVKRDALFNQTINIGSMNVGVAQRSNTIGPHIVG